MFVYFSITSLKQQNGYTEVVCMCAETNSCPILCFVIEIYLFIYAFLSFNLYTLFTLFSFKGLQCTNFYFLILNFFFAWPSLCLVMKTQMPKSSGRRAVNHC